MKPAIVVIAFNRPRSLQRILHYLNAARYPAADIELVLSVDFSPSDNGNATREIARGFEWQHGTKRLILHSRNLGLRRHVLRCGALSAQYGSIVLLEDDLSVGPEFYQFASCALKKTDQNRSVAGISLYDHKTNFVNRLPFYPLQDAFDNYFLQIASSWGQGWTATQWNGFSAWYESICNATTNQPVMIPESAAIPRAVRNWPDSSWLKYFNWYLAETGRYFLYPRVSHTTNHSDSGTHVGRGSRVWQVPLLLQPIDFRLSSPDQSMAVYDSFFEIDPERLKNIHPALAELEFDIDFYGTKQDALLRKPLVLTSRNIKPNTGLQKFDLVRKPFEANLDVESDSADATFVMSEPRNLLPGSRLSLDDISVVEYFYGAIPLRQLTKNAVRYWWQRR